MKGKGALLLVIVVLLLSTASGVIFWRYARMVKENTQLQEKLALTFEELEKARARISADMDDEPIPRPDWERLKTKARPDPRAWISASLLSRDDIIPWEGIHGGTMRIYDPSLVWFVGPSWCIVWAEDGHIGGYMLLRFDPGAEEPNWRLLDSEMAD
ncbi:MAG: hypothetical protein Q7I97_04290 [Thermovirgaceae bacterium]|nr:hypothetical protein [Thermovirgaceae bacterium]